MKLVMVSGGFDPIHVGHVRMFNEASKLGKVVVVLNSNEWLVRKKGKYFQSFDDRREIILNLRSVYDVVSVDDSDGTVCEALRRIQPHIFANGGDRVADNVPEVEVCRDLGIQLAWNIGGEKIRSSSELLGRYEKS